MWLKTYFQELLAKTGSNMRSKVMTNTIHTKMPNTLGAVKHFKLCNRDYLSSLKAIKNESDKTFAARVCFQILWQPKLATRRSSQQKQERNMVTSNWHMGSLLFLNLCWSQFKNKCNPWVFFPNKTSASINFTQ